MRGDYLLDVLTHAIPALSSLLAVIAGVLAVVAQSYFALRRDRDRKAQIEVPLDLQNLPGGAVKGAGHIRIEDKDKRVETAASISASLLQEYHAQGLSQSRISFWFSIIFASIGFAIIAMSVGLFIQQQATISGGGGWLDAAAKPAFTLVSGVVIEAVSALFFVQSNKTRELMTAFFDKLRSDRKLDESLQLMDGISSNPISSRLRAVVALHFAEVKLDHESIKYLLGNEVQPQTGGRSARRGESTKFTSDARSPTNSSDPANPAGPE